MTRNLLAPSLMVMNSMDVLFASMKRSPGEEATAVVAAAAEVVAAAEVEEALAAAAEVATEAEEGEFKSCFTVQLSCHAMRLLTMSPVALQL